MTTMDEACRGVVERVDGAMACCVIDLDTGLVLGAFSTAGFDQDLLDLVAMTTVDVFRGPNVSRIESMVRAHYGIDDNGDHYVRDLYAASERSAHFARTICQGRAVIVLATEQSTNIGMGWAQLRAAIPSVEGLVP